MKQKQALELQKFQLKMQEDEFELNTKLAISEAKTNVLLRLENNDIESTLSSDCSSDFDANIKKD